MTTPTAPGADLLWAVLALIVGAGGFAGGLVLGRRPRPLDLLGAMVAPLGLLLAGLGLGELVFPGFWRR